jgi:NhaC family Na+:H+ antiporter
MAVGLIIGLIAFILVGRKRGFTLSELINMCWNGAKEAAIIVKIVCVISFLTATWRISGTITIFVYYGMKLITPSLFLIITFLLSCLLSYALGTSYGVAGTVGVIFMTLARSGNVNPVLTAGVLISGIYFGDRDSPVSSNTNLLATLSETDIYSNVKMLLRTGMLPFFICCIVYSIFSIQNPLTHVDKSLIEMFENEFTLSLWAFVPAIFMIVMPLLRIKLITSMWTSIILGSLVAVFIQKVSVLEIVKSWLLGYQSPNESLGSILNGGGLASMVTLLFILLLSCAYSGLFKGTKMLENLQEKLAHYCQKYGRFPVMLCTSFFSAAIFCNQTIASLICCNLLKTPYLDSGASNEELAIDMGNSVGMLGCFLPWSIACSVMFSFFSVDMACLPYAVYMYAVPICYLFTKKHWY